MVTVPYVRCSVYCGQRFTKFELLYLLKHGHKYSINQKEPTCFEIQKWQITNLNALHHFGQMQDSLNNSSALSSPIPHAQKAEDFSQSGVLRVIEGVLHHLSLSPLVRSRAFQLSSVPTSLAFLAGRTLLQHNWRADDSQPTSNDVGFGEELRGARQRRQGTRTRRRRSGDVGRSGPVGALHSPPSRGRQQNYGREPATPQAALRRLREGSSKSVALRAVYPG